MQSNAIISIVRIDCLIGIPNQKINTVMTKTDPKKIYCWVLIVITYLDTNFGNLKKRRKRLRIQVPYQARQNVAQANIMRTLLCMCFFLAQGQTVI